MNHLKDLISTGKVRNTDEFGFDADFIESQAFAFISIRTIKRLNSAFPETTGCKKVIYAGKFLILIISISLIYISLFF